jgi:hypothetical protein
MTLASFAAALLLYYSSNQQHNHMQHGIPRCRWSCMYYMGFCCIMLHTVSLMAGGSYQICC